MNARNTTSLDFFASHIRTASSAKGGAVANDIEPTNAKMRRLTSNCDGLVSAAIRR
jgi:hypothetical protein